MSAQVACWTEGVPVEAAALAQIATAARMPHIKRIAVMPDAHLGKGCTVGTAIAMQGAVSPAVIGVDIGCGMDFSRTGLFVEADPDLPALRARIQAAVPAGFSRDGSVGAWREETGGVPEAVRAAWGALEEEYEIICHGAPAMRHPNPLGQLGTLGSGNHFVELSLDEMGRVWVVIHSGSRGPGNKVGQHFTKAAKEMCAKWLVPLEDPDLAYLPEGTAIFNGYMRSVAWAQKYAAANRRLMMDAVLLDLACREMERHSCHHNFIQHEEVPGLGRALVARKGAVRAGVNDIVIIPGSMGARSFIGKGLGNKGSMETCSHGAGRVMSRTRARATITLEQHAAALAGVECDSTAATLDESPSAYKDIDAVMAAQVALVKPLHTLKQFLCVKGGLG
jgi:tRNA-splicing ligase RtcB